MKSNDWKFILNMFIVNRVLEIEGKKTAVS